MFGTPYKKARAKPWECLEPSMMEDAGYLDTKKLVETMTIAGQNLTDARSSAQYDTAGFAEVDDNKAAERMLNEDVPVNPANRPGLSELDAIDLLRTATERLKDQADAKAQAMADEKKQQAEKVVAAPSVAESPKSEGA